MANIVVTSYTNYIKVEFNDYYPTYYNKSVSYYNRNDIQYIDINSAGIEVHVLNSFQNWSLSYDGSYGFQVDSIDGASPSDNSDLADKIAALIIT